MIGIESFAQDNPGIFVRLRSLLLLSLFGAYRLAVATRGIEPAGELAARALAIARHWLALGILPPLLLAFLLGPSRASVLDRPRHPAFVFSILVLLPPLIEPRFRLPLYCLVAVYVFNAALTWLALSSAAKREVQFLGSLAAVVLFAYLLRPKRLAEVEQQAGRTKCSSSVRVCAVAILAAAQLANLFGYYKLSQSLSGLCIYSTFIALAVFTAQRVFTILLWRLSKRLRPSDWRWCDCIARASVAGYHG